MSAYAASTKVDCIPQVTAKSKNSLPWINKQILQTIAKRYACYRLLKTTWCDSTFYRYKSLRNKVVGLIREAIRRYFERISSTDRKIFWKAVKMLNTATSTIPTLTAQNGLQATTIAATKQKLSINFSSAVFIKCLPPLSDEDLLLPTSPTCSESILIAEEYVATALLKLDI